MRHNIAVSYTHLDVYKRQLSYRAFVYGTESEDKVKEAIYTLIPSAQAEDVYKRQVCDEAPPYFIMMVKKFNEDAPTPHFTEKAKTAKIPAKEGLTFFYSDILSLIHI